MSERKRRYAGLALAVPVLLGACFGARTGLSVQDPVERCSQVVRDLPVYLYFERASPVTSPVSRVTWHFRVGCNPPPPPYETYYYTFGVQQDAGGSPEWQGGDGRSVPPPLELLASPDPFAFTVRGPVTGDWCTTVEVEFADGTVRRRGPFRITEPQSRTVPIAVGLVHHGGENQVNTLYAVPGGCGP